MNDAIRSARSTVPGFWTRLMLALEAMGESYEERLEQRVNRLEAEVARLSKESQTRKEPARRSGQLK